MEMYKIKDVDEIIFVDYYNGWVPAEIDNTKHYVVFEEDEIYRGNGRVKVIISEGTELERIGIQYVKEGIRIHEVYELKQLFAI